KLLRGDKHTSFDNPQLGLIPTVVSSTARLGPMLAMQSQEQRQNIENAIIEGAKKYATDSGVEIPASVVLAVASKP
ncbi:hypothetical protein, partial [Nostoc sp. T09]|uniref:hypothetical protein n=1 Tax=Nostoc sp. T09 TaxID=1932621 RepID=UPI0015C4E94D